LSENIIEARGLSKRYGRIQAVVDLDLNVKRGECHGFLGPNGAGKTTVIKAFLGLTTPNAGEVSIFGRDLFLERDEIMRRVGAVVEAPALFGDFTARENLLYLSRLSSSAGGASSFLSPGKIDDALSTVGLEDAADRKVKGFSYGMKQRLGIAQALLPESELIFLDEPTNGLDPHGIMGVRDLIRRLKGELGITIFISSHLLAEIEHVCDRVTIIDRGRVVRESAVSELVAGGETLDVRVENAAVFAEFALSEGMTIVSRKDIDGGSGEFVVGGRESDVPALCRKLVRKKIGILGVSKRQNTLEDVFVELTGKGDSDSFAD